MIHEWYVALQLKVLALFGPAFVDIQLLGISCSVSFEWLVFLGGAYLPIR